MGTVSEKEVMKKLLLLALLCCLATAASASGRSETIGESGSRVILRVAWWGSQQRHERTIRVLQMFERENPNVTVYYDFAGWEDYWTKLVTMAAGNNLPDVMQQDYQYLQEWADRGLIVPLDVYLGGAGAELQGVPESSLASGRIGGRLYGVNLGDNSLCMMLDVDAFSRAGVALPSDDWSWADWETVCLILTRTLGMPAMSGQPAHDHIWRALYLGRGFWGFSEDGASLGYPEEQDALFAEHLKRAKRVLDAGAIIPYSEVVASRTKGVEDDWIVQGRSAITFAWSNQVVAVWSAAGIDSRRFELRPLPRAGAGALSSNYLKPSMFLSITKNAMNRDLGVRLIRYFTESIEANRVLLAERGVPISGRVREALKGTLEAPQRVVFDYLDRVARVARPIPPPDPPGASDLINNVYYPQVVDPVMFGVISPEEGARKLRQEAPRILGQGGASARSW
jgi:multiple sugar transport system substrate-binding protein